MYKKRRVIAVLVFLSIVVAFFLQGCVSRIPIAIPEFAPVEAPTMDEYFAWAANHRKEIIAYQAFLDEQAVGDIVPLSQLLKSARDWKRCNADPFSVPPKELWPNIVPTLQVVKKLKADGVLVNPVAASAYRDPVLNVCAGGSLKSKHLQLNAIDFDIEATPTSLATLCNAWKTSGPELNLGLGFYTTTNTTTKIHLDTLGFRSWGPDYTHKTSPCLQTKSTVQ
ncbi:MAG: D-Ala-D-Ala carboxypeptidase family metallohydrolase [Arenimonas sp.]